MSKPALAAVLGIGVLALLVLARGPTVAQELDAPQKELVSAVVDVTPIRQEIAALRAEVAAVRAAIADEEGMRADLAKATAAMEKTREEIEGLTQIVEDYTKATQPVIEALEPAERWEYYILHNRSDRSANRLGSEGWELVTSAEDWLVFKRPLAGKPPRRAIEE